MGEHFRTVLLFKDESRSDFINKFSNCEPRMLESLQHLKGAADNVDCRNAMAKIISVLGSLVGIFGGLFSIVGLVWSASTALTKWGGYLGLGSIFIIVLAFIIECCCNPKKKADKHFLILQSLHVCLETVTSHPLTQKQESKEDVVVGEGKGVVRVSKVVDKFRAVVKFIDLPADIVGASDVPDICQTACKGLFANLDLIVPNAISFFVDFFFVCKQTYSLTKCHKTEVSQFIRARAAFWRSQLNSWKKIHESLCEGQRTSEEHRAVLDKLSREGNKEQRLNK